MWDSASLMCPELSMADGGAEETSAHPQIEESVQTLCDLEQQHTFCSGELLPTLKGAVLLA